MKDIRNPVRIRLLEVIARKGKVSVEEIRREVVAEPSIIYYHLKVLEREGYIEEDEGYELTAKGARAYKRLMKEEVVVPVSFPSILKFNVLIENEKLGLLALISSLIVLFAVTYYSKRGVFLYHVFESSFLALPLSILGILLYLAFISLLGRQLDCLGAGELYPSLFPFIPTWLSLLFEGIQYWRALHFILQLLSIVLGGIYLRSAFFIKLEKGILIYTFLYLITIPVLLI